MGLAPTTSTTVMLALGDAMSVALLERKGFSSDEFHVLHPGGKLGRRLIKVSDIMHSGNEMPLAGPDTLMSDALIEMTAKSFGCIGIIGSEKFLQGVITDGDLRRHMDADLIGKKTGEVMTKGVATVNPKMLASVALGIMNARAITNIFVTKGDCPVGILHIHDCLRAGVA
jgi:arabinose-5-phosphate isomerase